DHLSRSLPVQTIEAAPADATHGNEPGFLQHAEVARRGRPAVLEARRQIPRGQLAAEVAQDDQDIAARLVRQGAEDRLGVRRGRLRHACHLLAPGLIISKRRNYRRAASSSASYEIPASTRMPSTSRIHRSNRW